LTYLAKLLQSPKPNVVKESAWAVANIAAGTVYQIQKIGDAGIIPILLHVLQYVSIIVLFSWDWTSSLPSNN